MKTRTILTALMFTLVAVIANGQGLNVENPSFEVNDGGAFNGAVTGWMEFQEFNSCCGGNGAGIWGAVGGFSGTQGFPTFHGDSAGTLITRFDQDKDDSWVFQSVGTIEAGDVGKELTLTAHLGGRSDVSGARVAEADVTVAFRTSADGGIAAGPGAFGEAGVDAFLGDVLGTTGEATLNIPATDDGGNFIPLELAPYAASFTPDASHIGQEVFAVISLHEVSRTGPAGEDQWIVDNVVLTQVPEPSCLSLVVLGLVVSLRLTRRRT